MTVENVAASWPRLSSLVAAIHAFLLGNKTWVAGPSLTKSSHDGGEAETLPIRLNRGNWLVQT